MRNDYIDEIIRRICDGEDVTEAQYELSRAYTKRHYKDNGLFCFDQPIKPMEAGPLCVELKCAGVHEFYITGEWGNQFVSWATIEAIGFKIRGMVLIENPYYLDDVLSFGSSDRPAKLLAMKFSLEDEKNDV